MPEWKDTCVRHVCKHHFSHRFKRPTDCLNESCS